MKWGKVYARDLYRCASPTCFRRDATPHHMKFRSAGGGDEVENMISACPWCHLEGVHKHRSVKVKPPASRVEWTFGREPLFTVKGREKQPAS